MPEQEQGVPQESYEKLHAELRREEELRIGVEERVERVVRGKVLAEVWETLEALPVYMTPTRELGSGTPTVFPSLRKSEVLSKLTEETGAPEEETTEESSTDAGELPDRLREVADRTVKWGTDLRQAEEQPIPRDPRRMSEAMVRDGSFFDDAVLLREAAAHIEGLKRLYKETHGQVLALIASRERVHAAAESDADLAALPALRDFLLRETASNAPPSLIGHEPSEGSGAPLPEKGGRIDLADVAVGDFLKRNRDAPPEYVLAAGPKRLHLEQKVQFMEEPERFYRTREEIENGDFEIWRLPAARPLPEGEKCENCGGVGSYVTGDAPHDESHTHRETCEDCHGTGKKPLPEAPGCGGSGRITERRRAPVTEEWFNADVGPCLGCKDCNPVEEEVSTEEAKVQRVAHAIAAHLTTDDDLQEDFCLSVARDALRAADVPESFPPSHFAHRFQEPEPNALISKPSDLSTSTDGERCLSCGWKAPKTPVQCPRCLGVVAASSSGSGDAEEGKP